MKMKRNNNMFSSFYVVVEFSYSDIKPRRMLNSSSGFLNRLRITVFYFNTIYSLNISFLSSVFVRWKIQIKNSGTTRLTYLFLFVDLCMTHNEGNRTWTQSILHNIENLSFYKKYLTFLLHKNWLTSTAYISSNCKLHFIVV